MEPPPAELTYICMDNSEMVKWHPFVFRAQIDAMVFCCETLFKSNPDNAVCLYLMTEFRILVGPTRDLQEILSHLQFVPGVGDSYFSVALSKACKALSLTPTHMKRRLLMFVASRLEFGSVHPSSCGRALKESGVTVNIFSFISKSNTDEYTRDLLDAFDTTVNSDGISSIQYVPYKSRLHDMLSESILKEHLDYISKMACNEKNGAAAGVRDIKISDLSGIKKVYGPRDHNIVYLPPIRANCSRVIITPELIEISSQTSGKLNQEKAETIQKENAQTRSELSCNEKNQAAAE